MLTYRYWEDEYKKANLEILKLRGNSEEHTCMSMMMRAVLSGRRFPSYGHLYGIESTNTIASCKMISIDTDEYSLQFTHI